MNAIEKAKQEVENLRLELSQLREKKREMTRQVEEADKRIRELVGFYSSRGLIGQAERELKRAEREAKDATARRVIWVTEPWGRTGDKPYVVDKITPKRIYVRRMGNEKSSRGARRDRLDNWQTDYLEGARH